MYTEQPITDAELSPRDEDAARPGDRAEPDELRRATSRRPTDLLTAVELERLSERSDAHGVVYFIVHYGLIGAGGWLCWLTYPGAAFPFALLAHAVVIGFLFSPLHECAHGTAFRSRCLNESVLWITAVVYIVPPCYFRYFHLGHHRFTQVPGKDPSLVLPEPATFGQYLWYCGALWFWWRNLSWMVKHAFGALHPASQLYVPKSRHSLMILESRILVAVYVTVAAGVIYLDIGAMVVICWLVPRFLGEPLQRMLRVAEHVGCEESTDLLRNTRTTLTSPIVSALAWQMPYHAEHHLYPNVPFHALARLHRKVRDHVVVEPRGYVAGQLAIIRGLKRTAAHGGRRDRGQAPLL